MAPVDLDRVTKRWGDTVAVDSVNLTIPDGEFMVLVGPSGCGKTTILRMIAGLETLTDGEIYIGGRAVSTLEPRQRDIAMVFQDYALYPHMNVAQNLGFGLRFRGVKRRARAARVADAAKMLGLARLLDRKPSELSGGQRQRVAIGRAIVRDPQAFLMDEPLSNLDAKLRVHMRSELGRLREELRATTIFVTHDQVEAMTLGHRVAVLRDGVLQQVARPQELYMDPANLFVATFIGSPSMNVMQARLDSEHVEVAGQRLPLPAPSPAALSGREVLLGLRPAAFEDATFARPGLPSLTADVEFVEQLGDETHVLLALDAPAAAVSHILGTGAGVSGDDDSQLLTGDARARIMARVTNKTQAQIGRSLRLAMDPEAVYLFDPQSGERLTLDPQTAESTKAISNRA